MPFVCYACFFFIRYFLLWMLSFDQFRDKQKFTLNRYYLGSLNERSLNLNLTQDKAARYKWHVNCYVEGHPKEMVRLLFNGLNSS